MTDLQPMLRCDAGLTERNRIVGIIDELAEKNPLARTVCAIILKRIDPELIPDDTRRAWARWWSR